MGQNAVVVGGGTKNSENFAEMKAVATAEARRAAVMEYAAQIAAVGGNIAGVCVVTVD